MKKTDPGRFEMFAGGGLAAVVIFSVGVFMSVVPVIGWIVGPGLMITAGLIAIGHVVGIFRAKPSYTGHCPNCGAPAAAGDPGSVGMCEACHSGFAHHDNQLWKLEA
ncbi:MAG: hypothetical protein LAO79_03855 [Acidobacteriia bacterium]|nr:hypothetical protein [Terriglobia bacterium]